MKPFDLKQWNKFQEARGFLNASAIIDYVSVDSRDIRNKNTLFVALKGKNVDGHDYLSEASSAGARYALVEDSYKGSRDIGRMRLLRVENTIQALQELAMLYRKTLTTKVIAITGSYGKTLLKDLLLEILQKKYSVGGSPESFNSQIGVPLSLFSLEDGLDYALIEVGISRLGDMNPLIAMISPDYGILTTLGQAHISTMGSLDAIAEEKVKLLQAVPQQGWALFPRHPLLSSYEGSITAKQHHWNEPSSDLPIVQRIPGDLLEYHITFPNKSTSKICLHEKRLDYDLLEIATKAAWLLGIPPHHLTKALECYIPEETNLVMWRAPSGATIINKSYQTHPLSTSHALKKLNRYSTKGKKIFVFGGLKEKKGEAPCQAIIKAIAQYNIDIFVIVGDAKEYFPVEKLKQMAPHTEIIFCNDAIKALAQLRNHVKADDNILIQGPHKAQWEELYFSFSEGLSSNKLTINLAAVKANIESFQAKLPSHTRIMVMLKAQGYGTDGVIMGKFLEEEGIDIFGVANVDEAVMLREGGIQNSIFVLHAAAYELKKLVKGAFEVGISQEADIHRLEEEAVQQGKSIKVHLNIDTGMSRFGCRPEEALAIANAIATCSHLKLEGLMTHLACAEDKNEDAFTMLQLKKFNDTIRILEENGFKPPYKHISNSSGAIRFQQSEWNMVRIGISTFGIYPSEHLQKKIYLRSALSLSSRIISINICKAGETISYGRNYIATESEEKIAIIPLGYFDGINQRYSKKNNVIIRKQKAPIVGTICMDFMMINITHIPDAAIGDEVLFFGEGYDGQGHSPEAFANHAGISVYELISCLGPRIQRVFTSEEKDISYD